MALANLTWNQTFQENLANFKDFKKTSRSLRRKTYNMKLRIQKIDNQKLNSLF